MRISSVGQCVISVGLEKPLADMPYVAFRLAVGGVTINRLFSDPSDIALAIMEISGSISHAQLTDAAMALYDLYPSKGGVARSYYKYLGRGGGAKCVK